MENKTNITDKLSNSAKQELVKISCELNNVILEKAYIYSMKSNSLGEEISLSNLIDAKNDLLGENKEKSLKFIRIIKNGLRFAYLGILTIIMGLISFILLYYLSKSPTLYDTISIIFFLVIGVVLLIFGLLGLTLILGSKEKELKNNSYKTDSNFDSRVVKKWTLIEQLTTNLMLKKGMPKNEAKSISFMVKYIDQFFTEMNEKEDIRKLLYARNKIIHEGYSLTIQEEVELIKIANRIILILEQKSK